jgi:hypothetical protein
VFASLLGSFSSKSKPALQPLKALMAPPIFKAAMCRETNIYE